MVSNGKLMAFINALGGGAPAPSEVVILPETELMTVNVEEGSNGQYVLTTPLENTPTVGVTYKMFWGGVEYTSKAVEVLIEAAGAAGIALGNTDYLGMDNVENPGADMPILVVLFPDGVIEDPGDPVMYCMAVSMGITPDPPVLSIVQMEGGSTDSGNTSGGVLVVNVECDANEDMTQFTNATKDKTFEEIKAVYDAGGVVHCRLKYLSGPMAGTRFDWPIVANVNSDGVEGFSFVQPMNMGATLITISSNDSIMVYLD